MIKSILHAIDVEIRDKDYVAAFFVCIWFLLSTIVIIVAAGSILIGIIAASLEVPYLVPVFAAIVGAPYLLFRWRKKMVEKESKEQ